MKLLLDTHIWLWSLLEPARLSSRVAAALADPTNEIWLSPISVWELLVLTQKGRVKLNEDVDEWIQQALRSAPLKEAPLTFEVAQEVGKLSLPHRDPADRFLIASAKVFGLTLVTSDQNLIDAKVVPVMVNLRSTA